MVEVEFSGGLKSSSYKTFKKGYEPEDAQSKKPSGCASADILDGVLVLY